MSADIVSVVMPVFNRPVLALQAIESVREQSFPDFELIVVDDGSFPALELPEAVLLDHRVRLIRLDKNRGPSAARNAGARASSGKWLAWLDSDDMWHRHKLEKQMLCLQKMGAAGLNTALACGFAYRNASGTGRQHIPVPASDPDLFFSGCWFCPGSTIILSRALFERIGPYDETLPRLEDLDWFARMGLAGGKLEVVEENLVTIKQGDKANLDKVQQAGKVLQLKYEKKRPAVSRQILLNLRAYIYLEYAASALKFERRYFLGLGYLAASWYYHPRRRLQLYDFWK